MIHLKYIKENGKNILNKHIGSSFDSFLTDEGILEETQATAIKTVLAMHITRQLEFDHLTLPMDKSRGFLLHREQLTT